MSDEFLDGLAVFARENKTEVRAEGSYVELAQGNEAQMGMGDDRWSLNIEYVLVGKE